MRYPWANVALFVLLTVQMLTGFYGLIAGSISQSWILRVHDAIGYGLLLLVFWKGVIVVDAIRRKRKFTLPRIAFLVFAVLFIATMITGLVWIWTGYVSYFGFSLMTIHVLLALATLGLFAWHTLARSYVFKSPTLHERRAFLFSAGVLVAGYLLSQMTEIAAAAAAVPGAVRRFTGSYRESRSELPVVSWLVDFPEPVSLERWRLVVDGLVECVLVVDYAELMRVEQESKREAIDCTGGWYSQQEWTGVGIAWLLDQAGVKQGAQSITVESVSGYSRRFALDEVGQLLLATRVGGNVLDHGHGFPLRLVAPGHRGFEWVKWIVAVHVNDTGAALQPPVPLQ